MTDKEVKEANEVVNNCRWRFIADGIPVCKGMVYPCEKIIDDGKCPELIDFFKRINSKKKDEE